MYEAIAYDLGPGDFLIIQHAMQSKPNGAFVDKSDTPLSGLNSTYDQWYYDNNTRLFSYISM